MSAGKSPDEKTRALIVDDEPLARRTLRQLVEQDPESCVAGECADGQQAVKALRDGSYDILFLDVQMPGMNGFEVLEAAGVDRVPVVVFVTAYDQYAIKAFEVNAVDYLLKPFDDERFSAALARAKEQLLELRARDMSRRLLALLEQVAAGRHFGGPPRDEPPNAYLQRIGVRGVGHVTFVRVQEIDWIQAAAQYVELHVGAKSHLVRESINRLEAQLDPSRFFRIHRSAIVNLDRIREVRRDLGGNKVVLQNGTRIPISRNRRERLERVLTGSL